MQMTWQTEIKFSAGQNLALCGSARQGGCGRHQLGEVGQHKAGLRGAARGEVEQLRVAVDEGRGRLAAQELRVPQHVLQEQDVGLHARTAHFEFSSAAWELTNSQHTTTFVYATRISIMHEQRSSARNKRLYIGLCRQTACRQASTEMQY